MPGLFQQAIKDLLAEGKDALGEAVSQRSVSAWAGYKSNICQRWLEDSSKPPYENLTKLLPHLHADWAKKLRLAWEEDDTAPHLWAELVRLRKLDETGERSDFVRCLERIEGRVAKDATLTDALSIILEGIEANPELLKGLVGAAAALGVRIKHSEHAQEQRKKIQ